MVVEQVTLSVHEGQQAAFEVAMAEAQAVLLGAPGSRSVALARGVECPAKYVLRIEWDTVDAHIAFTRTEGINRFRSLVGRFFAEKPAMEHFIPVSLQTSV